MPFPPHIERVLTAYGIRADTKAALYDLYLSMGGEVLEVFADLAEGGTAATMLEADGAPTRRERGAERRRRRGSRRRRARRLCRGGASGGLGRAVTGSGCKACRLRVSGIRARRKG